MQKPSTLYTMHVAPDDRPIFAAQMDYVQGPVLACGCHMTTMRTKESGPKDPLDFLLEIQADNALDISGLRSACCFIEVHLGAYITATE